MAGHSAEPIASPILPINFSPPSFSIAKPPSLLFHSSLPFISLISGGRRVSLTLIEPPTIRSPFSLSSIAELRPDIVILFGGPHSIHVDGTPSFLDGFLQYVEENYMYMLEIYYDMWLTVQKLGGEVAVGEKQEYGKMEISVEKEECRLYGPEAICGTQMVWMSHGDEVVKLPEGFRMVVRSLQGSVAAIENHSIRFYGFQYHPEVMHSPKGIETLWHFLFDVHGLTADWRIQDVLEEEIKVIKGLVGPAEHVICALFGRVDSIVVATLVHKAIGDRLHYVFVDNGLFEV